MSTFAALAELRSAGMMPTQGLLWIGIGERPAKRNAIAINPELLPTEDECQAVAGLDVCVVIHGYRTRYGAVHRLCSNLYQANPARLQLHDVDFRKCAFLKLGEP